MKKETLQLNKSSGITNRELLFRSIICVSDGTAQKNSFLRRFAGFSRDTKEISGGIGCPRISFYALTFFGPKTCISLSACALGRIHLMICSLKRYLFAPCWVENARKNLRVLLRFSPCMAQKSPLFRRFAVFSRDTKEISGGIGCPRISFYALTFFRPKTCISLSACALAPAAVFLSRDL
jgi:hypothetical protein